MTNGSKINISYTGTTIKYEPGIITGGTINHNCPLSRGIGYFIEPLLYLGPFSKRPFKISFSGITTNGIDLGVESIRTSLFPLCEKFGILNQEIAVSKRGSSPLGGGEVHLFLPHLIATPKTLHATEIPKVNKIFGIAYSTRVSPSAVNRMIDAARTTLRWTKVETMIHSDVARGEESGKSPGFGITLVAETSKGWCYFAEGVSAPGVVAEDIGTLVAKKLLNEIENSGVVGKNQLQLTLIFMILGREDIGRIRISKKSVDEKFVNLVRDIKDILNVEIILQECEDSEDDLMLIVRGVGFVSASKKIA